MSGEIKDVRPDQRWAHTIAMHGPREGAGTVGLRGMRVEHFAVPIGLGSSARFTLAKEHTETFVIYRSSTPPKYVGLLSSKWSSASGVSP